MKKIILIVFLLLFLLNVGGYSLLSQPAPSSTPSGISESAASATPSGGVSTTTTNPETGSTTTTTVEPGMVSSETTIPTDVGPPTQIDTYVDTSTGVSNTTVKQFNPDTGKTDRIQIISDPIYGRQTVIDQESGEQENRNITYGDTVVPGPTIMKVKPSGKVEVTLPGGAKIDIQTTPLPKGVGVLVPPTIFFPQQKPPIKPPQAIEQPKPGPQQPQAIQKPKPAPQQLSLIQNILQSVSEFISDLFSPLFPKPKPPAQAPAAAPPKPAATCSSNRDCSKPQRFCENSGTLVTVAVTCKDGVCEPKKPEKRKCKNGCGVRTDLKPLQQNCCPPGQAGKNCLIAEACNNDGVCDYPYETSLTCNDCVRDCNNDGVCDYLDGGEDENNCPNDCKPECRSDSDCGELRRYCDGNDLVHENPRCDGAGTPVAKCVHGIARGRCQYGCGLVNGKETCYPSEGYPGSYPIA